MFKNVCFMINLSEIAGSMQSVSKCLWLNKKELQMALDSLIHNVLFPVCQNNQSKEKSLYLFYSVMVDNISTLMEKKSAHQIVDIFVKGLPTLQRKLYADADVFFQNDPAANSIEEVIIAYPGFFALTVHRISNVFFRLGVPIIPRLFSEYAHSLVGVDINPGAKIGHSLYIDHGTGIVIGETTVIGNNVKIYQGVTLGALFVTKELSNKKRHPTIEDNVVIYAGATILGGNTVIGHDSTIGGNVWLTKSVVPYSQVVQNVQIRIRRSPELDDAIDYFI